MLKLKSKLVAVLAVVTSFFLIGSVAMLLGNKNASAEVEWAEGSLSGVESSYVVGDKLNISTVQLVYEGETYTVTEKWMYTPSSQLVKFEGDYTFEETGNHELKCIAQVGDEQISKSKLIKVDDKSYNTNFATVEKIDALTTVKSSTQSGLHVNIPYTDSFDWGEVIDLRDSSEIISFLPYQYSKQKRTETQVPVLDENGEQLVVDGQPVFETVVNPTEKQADKIYVRITDAYDKTNYVDVRLLFSIANNKNKIVNQMPAYSAGHRGNPLRAMSTETTRDSREGQLTMINGEEYFVVYNNFGGYPKNGEIAENSSLITLYFDVNTQQVSVKQATLTDGEQTAVINDLDAPEIYGNNVFKGFTTGEVYLSIFAERYEGTRLDMEIASIGTKSGDELVSDSVLDLVAPQIVLDISQDQYDNKLFVATGSEVSIVPVKYYDINLAFTTEQVLYNDTQNVTLKDGKFIASKQGKYNHFLTFH